MSNEQENSVDRRQLVSALIDGLPQQALVISGLGSPSYDLFAAGDRELNFYLWGAMGGASSLALGLALAQPARPVLAITGDGEQLMGIGSLEYHGQLSLLKGGIRFADQVNTVSPTYCREIQTPQQGMGMDGLLRSRAGQLHGVLNGLDGQYWSPDRDPALAHSYSAAKTAGKKLCKQALQAELGLQSSPDTPLVAMVTRLDSQKGIELVLESWEQVMSLDLQLVILGTGNPDFERRLAEAASFYPGKASVMLRFDDALSRRIYSGSDIFLMPSRYEPCGLGQLIALRYGSVPLVHATGGLADTIIDPDDSPATANGFIFNAYRHASMLTGLGRALAAYRETGTWQKIMRAGMDRDMSWQKAAEQYVDLYRICTRKM